MRVLLVGYFGQRNMGDEMTSYAVIELAAARWGVRNFDILNLATPSDVDVHDMSFMFPEYSFRRVWFDSVRRLKYDAAMIINSGWIHSFCLDVAMHLIDTGVPLYVLCAKNITDLVPGGMCQRAMKDIAKKAEVFICRFGEEATATGGIYGLDMAELLSPPEQGRVETGTLVYCPRWFEEEDARAYSASHIQMAAEENAVILACNPFDAKLCDDMDVRLVRGWLEPLEALHIIANASGVISGGRLHPVLLASSFSVPCCVLDVMHDSHNMRKLNLLEKEMGVPAVCEYGHPETICDAHFQPRAERTVSALKAAGFVMPGSFRFK